MSWIALRMLTGDRSKYYGIVFGITFASLLIAQQGAIFCGLMLRTSSQIADIQGADIWVMDPGVQFVDDIKPMSENELYRVRGVEGVGWAVRFYKGLARSRFSDGKFQQFILLGLDDATLVGAPREMVQGSLDDLRQPDAVIMDEGGYKYLWPNEPFELGRTFEMNDRRAVLVGLCKASPTFQTFPIVYARYSQATMFVPRERKLMSFILADPAPGWTSQQVCEQIQQQTGLLAKTREEFIWTTIMYYMIRTGIPINFGITISLGFVVGTAIAGQTFYLFVIENLRQFGALKAMGVTNIRIVGMILLQAFVVGLLGYGLGVGAATLFGELSKENMTLAYYMPWQVLALTGGAVFFIGILASLLSVRRVLVLEPGIVFR
ncbi:MAG: FtsX-like permease family protein [Planctomyces sp.]|nr:FtsX-like permease family protein [Planctomyces sp.]